jgi:hypothetical protein
MDMSTQPHDSQYLFLETLRHSLTDSPHFQFHWSLSADSKSEKDLIYSTIQRFWKSHFSSLLQEQWYLEFLKIKQELQSRTRCREFKVELNTVRSDQCRLFHVDRVALRMICTYIGPGTQICRDANANRMALGLGDNYKIVRDWKKIYQAKTGEYCFLAGDLHPENLGRGVIHRSPPIEKDQIVRLVLKIDENR